MVLINQAIKVNKINRSHRKEVDTMLDLLPIKRRHEVPSLFKEMEDVVRRLWDTFPEGEFIPDLTREWTPRLDLAETETAIEIKAELPGLDKKDIDISLEGDTLLIKGEKRQEKEVKDKRFHRVERAYGSFYRTIRLPAEVQPDKIEAAYEDGVLKVTLPKTEEAQKGITHIDVH